MLTTFGRQLALVVALFFLTRQGRTLVAQGKDAACRQAGVCVVVYRR